MIQSNEVEPKNILIRQKKCSDTIFRHLYYGLTFGHGHDLYIYSDTMINIKLYSHLEESYDRLMSFCLDPKNQKFYRLRCSIIFHSSFFD